MPIPTCAEVIAFLEAQNPPNFTDVIAYLESQTFAYTATVPNGGFCPAEFDESEFAHDEDSTYSYPWQFIIEDYESKGLATIVSSATSGFPYVLPLTLA